MNAAQDSNPTAFEVLLRSHEAINLKDHFNNHILMLGKAMLQDTYELRPGAYTRKNFTVAALMAYDGEVRRMAQRAGVDLSDFDDAIARAMELILAETTRTNPVGVKIAKAVKDAYNNGQYR